MNDLLQRACLLYDQHRFTQAEESLRMVLLADPSCAHAKSLLALCLIQRHAFSEAEILAHAAVEIEPEFSFTHYALAEVLTDRHRPTEALAAIQEALRLDPHDPDYYALLAQIHIQNSAWEKARQAAQLGLLYHPEHTPCINLRATALRQLGQTQEADITIRNALARNPNDTYSHTNLAWVHIEHQQPEEALKHFREALRLDPNNDWARAGLVEALKARYWLYAWMLRYFLWMSKLSTRAQWGILLAGYFGNRLLSILSKSHPSLTPWILPVQILYLSLILLSWLAYPLFNLFLRFSRDGRHALSPDQRRASTCVGICLLTSLLSLLAAFVLAYLLPRLTGNPSISSHLTTWILLLALSSGILSIPYTACFQCSKGWPRNGMLAYSLVLTLSGLCGLALLHPYFPVKAPGEPLLFVFFIGTLLSGWIANILMGITPKR